MNKLLFIASLAVLSQLPHLALSAGEGISALDRRFESFLTLGCWKDKCNADCSQRLLENMEGKSQYINATLYGHYKRRSNAVHRCADAALDLGYDIFAIQDGGQCFSGKDAGKKYKDNGKSTDCASMKGGPLANDVYTISPLKKCLCLMPKKYHALPKGKICYTHENEKNPKDNRTALHVAARNNDLECATILANAGSKLEAKDKDGKTPLNLAAGFKKCGTVNVLVTMNATQSAGDKTNIKACVPEKPTASASKTGSPYKLLGCFVDKHPARAIPTLEGNDKVKSILTGHYKRRDNALQKCMEAAKSLKFNAFALQDGGQCFASKNARVAALKYGKSPKCKDDGKGGPLASAVYEILN